VNNDALRGRINNSKNPAEQFGRIMGPFWVEPREPSTWRFQGAKKQYNPVLMGKQKYLSIKQNGLGEDRGGVPQRNEEMCRKSS